MNCPSPEPKEPQVRRNVPLRSNTWTRWPMGGVPASVTNTSLPLPSLSISSPLSSSSSFPLISPSFTPPLSCTATPIGNMNCPFPGPKEPQVRRNVPSRLNTWTRWLKSTTNTSSPCTATPNGELNCPSPEPKEPHVRKKVSPLATEPPIMIHTRLIAMASPTGFLFNTENTAQRRNITFNIWLSVISFSSPGSFRLALQDGLDNTALRTRDVSNRTAPPKEQTASRIVSGSRRYATKPRLVTGI